MFRPSRALWLAAAVLLPIAGACMNTEPTGPTLVPTTCEFDFAFDDMATDTVGMTRTTSGLQFRDLTVGTGEPVLQGGGVYVHYTGWLVDGEAFGESLPGLDFPFGFELGHPEIITGFNEGVSGMRVGGCRQIVLPPALGYGSAGRDGIPPNSTLIFEIGVVGID
jgi:FKBP-type peptidyl-prolyl cis-trans isomerase